MKRVGDARVWMRMIGSMDVGVVCGDDMVAEDEDQTECLCFEEKKGKVIYVVVKFIGTRRPHR